MNGLLFLNTEDFVIQQGQKGKLLCNTIEGFSLILFYSTNCVHCKTLIPIFKNLPGTITGCHFGMVNVMNNKSIIEASQSTITKIEYVPYIVLYYNGKPYMAYAGNYTKNEILQFVVDVATNLQKKQQFSGNAQQRVTTSENRIPEYTIGLPVTGDKRSNVCWLSFDRAYTN